ncbi:MAG: glycosyltransferase [Thomasclavelia sp.]|nr:glycosyltransferase [Thomasclavelia sp.]
MIILKIKLYFGKFKSVEKSGIGRAGKHQQKALALNGIDYTTDIKDNDYDIIHINTIWPDSLKQIRYAKKHNKKVIMHAHSTQEDFKNSFKFSNLVAGPFKNWIIKMYSAGDHIITPTPYSKSILESYGITKPITAISNGVDLDDFNPTEAQINAFCSHFNIKNDDTIIVSVGWLFERKGFDTFVEVAKKLPDYKFLWFGDIKMSNPTEKIKKIINNLPDNVYLPGYVSNEVLQGAYGRSQVFFFPSREETEGIVVLEALSCQTQVVLRDIPVFDPWMIDKVNCYKGRSIKEFVDIIDGLVKKELPSTIEEGYKVAKERELSKIGIELKAVYENVLDK